MNQSSSLISDWLYLLLDSIQPIVMQYGKKTALVILVLLAVNLLLALALWLRGVGYKKQQRLEALERHYPFLKQEKGANT